jgi:hypothetical protein
MKLNLWNIKINFYLIILFFSIYFSIGLLVYKDYGLSIDEPIHRTLGYYWYLWLLKFFLINSESVILIENKFLSTDQEFIKILLKGDSLWYGPFFDLLTVFLEDKFNIVNLKEIYQFRHFINFIFFYSSSICLFFLLKFRFKNNLLSLIGVIFYISTPRFFAESFYNPKDIIFMSIGVFCLFYILKSLHELKILNLLILSFCCSLATNVRIMGIVFPVIFLFFFLINSLEIKNFFKKNLFLILFFLSFYFIFLILLWPYLWNDTISHLFNVFTAYKKVVGGTNFYLGEDISSKYLPWHYIFVWIAITIPLIYIPFILHTLFLVINKFFLNFLSIKKEGNLFKNKIEVYDFLFLIYFFLPIFYFISFNKPLIGGWRYLYFIFPSMIYFLIFSIDKIINFRTNLIFKNFFFILIFFTLLNNMFVLVKYHPFQNIYFNNLVEKKANQLFDIDYWGLANANAVSKIITDINTNKIATIRTSSFVPLHYSAYIIDDPLVGNLKFTGTINNNQDYIFTNYIYEQNPLLLKKYALPENFYKFLSFKVGDILIYDVYKRKL